ncbi:hypothetical protein M426DRAFT_10028 [Hypoxylon sp. CI-4A]|nr:hypothetical protein M426DRAFT_10028 [Hypoxylon sp. CI-4A]
MAQDQNASRIASIEDKIKEINKKYDDLTKKLAELLFQEIAQQKLSDEKTDLKKELAELKG